MNKQIKKRPPILGRNWRKELDNQFAKLPRNVEQEKREIGHLDTYFRNFKDIEFTTVLSTCGFHTTFDGSLFKPEAEVSLLHTEMDFYSIDLNEELSLVAYSNLENLLFLELVSLTVPLAMDLGYSQKKITQDLNKLTVIYNNTNKLWI